MLIKCHPKGVKNSVTFIYSAVTEIYPSNSCSAVAKQSNELKCLQNLLPNCRFDGCTININTMGQAAQNPL